MAPAKIGAAIQFVDTTAAITTRNTPALPAGLAVGNIITFHLAGGANNWTHQVTSGNGSITWTQLDALSTVVGLYETMWIGLVTSSSAGSSVITVTAKDSTGAIGGTRMWGQVQCWSGLDNSGAGGIAAVNQYAKFISATSVNTVSTPNTPTTSVPNCVLWSAGTGARGSAPAVSSLTYEGGTPDAVSPSAASLAFSGSAVSADLTPIALGATPGGKVFAFFDTTPTAITGSPRASWTLALAPTPVPPTTSAAISSTDPQTSTVLTLTGTVTSGAAASRLWSQVSGPQSPTITNATSDVATVTPGLPGVYVWQYTATNGAGTSTPVTVTAYVHAGDTVNTPVLAVTLGTWTALNGTTPEANLNDADATTGVQKSGTPTYTDVVQFLYPPLGPGVLSFDVDSYYTTTAVAARAIVYKADGTTVVYQDDWSPGSSNAVHVVTLNSTALAIIPLLTDRRALIMKVSAQ